MSDHIKRFLPKTLLSLLVPNGFGLDEAHDALIEVGDILDLGGQLVRKFEHFSHMFNLRMMHITASLSVQTCNGREV